MDLLCLPPTLLRSAVGRRVLAALANVWRQMAGLKPGNKKRHSNPFRITVPDLILCNCFDLFCYRVYLEYCIVVLIYYFVIEFTYYLTVIVHL